MGQAQVYVLLLGRHRWLQPPLLLPQRFLPPIRETKNNNSLCNKPFQMPPGFQQHYNCFRRCVVCVRTEQILLNDSFGVLFLAVFMLNKTKQFIYSFIYCQGTRDLSRVYSYPSPYACWDRMDGCISCQGQTTIINVTVNVAALAKRLILNGFPLPLQL